MTVTLTWWQLLLLMPVAWFVWELGIVGVKGFRRGWRDAAERMALEDSTVVGDDVDQALWALTDETRRKAGQ